MARPTKDGTIIKQNPNKSAYELLQLGISEAKYNELLKAENKQAPKQNIKEAEKAEAKAAPVIEPSEKLIPQIQTSQRATPVLRQHTPILTGNAIVRSPNGKKTSMDRAHAIKFVRKNPTYKIID